GVLRVLVMVQDDLLVHLFHSHVLSPPFLMLRLCSWVQVFCDAGRADVLKRSAATRVAGLDAEELLRLADALDEPVDLPLLVIDVEAGARRGLHTQARMGRPRAVVPHPDGDSLV